MKKVNTPLCYLNGERTKDYYVCKKECSWLFVPIVTQQGCGDLSIMVHWLKKAYEAGPEVCICAAIKMPDGYIIRGHRHNHCFQVLSSSKYSEAILPPENQGFITSHNRFVDRKEGYRLQIEAGIKSICRDGYRGKELFSEDLY